MSTSIQQRILAICIATLFAFIGVGSASAQWEQIRFGENVFWNEVFFADSLNGWITGQTALVAHTTNGGVTWGAVTIPGATFSSNRDIVFLNPNVGFVSGEDGIWRTGDGGLSWTDVTPQVAADNTLGAIWFRNDLVGICGFGACNATRVTFCRTTDGGASWSLVTYNHSLDVAVGGITYQNNVWFASGGLGKLWRSFDDGVSWSLTNTGSGGWQEDLLASSGNLFIASADGESCTASFSGKVLRSTNDGVSWTSRSFPTLMWGVTMYTPRDGWVCGDRGRAYRTNDAGVTWTESSCGLDPADRLDDIWFSDSTHGWAVGDGIYRYTVLTTLASNDAVLCDGDTVRLSVSGRGNIRWSPAEGLSCTTCPDPVASPTRTITYKVSVSGIVGCEGTDSVTVTVMPKPVAVASGTDTICVGDAAQLSASGGTSYNWTPAADLSCSDCANPIARPMQNTTYKVTVTDAGGCMATDSVLVSVNRVDAVVAPLHRLCVGDSLQLQVSGGVAWSWAPSQDISCTDCPSPIVRPDSTTTYSVTVTGTNGCIQIFPIRVEVAPLPSINADGGGTICMGGEKRLTASGGGSYLWSPSSGLSCIDCPDPVAQPDISTTYVVRVISPEGCIAYDTILVDVRPFALDLMELDSGIIDFDSVKLSSSSCRKIRVRNVSTEAFVLATPYLTGNLEFSLPPSQFPLVIQPGTDTVMTICYVPSGEFTHNDTLVIPDVCDRRIPMIARGVRYGIQDAILCDSLSIRIGKILSSEGFLRISRSVPNPVTGAGATVRWFVGRDAYVTIAIYDQLGRSVSVLFDNHATRGDHTTSWDATDVPSGNYFLRISSGTLVAGERVVVVR